MFCSLPITLVSMLLVATPAPPAAAAQQADFGRESLRATELAFAATVRDRDLAKFESFLAADAVFIDGDQALHGKAAIVAAWKSLFAADAPYFEWHPDFSELAGEGRLGLSRGPWTSRAKGKDGKEVEQHGVFNSIWRRGADGKWKIVFDAGCAPCAVK